MGVLNFKKDASGKEPGGKEAAGGSGAPGALMPEAQALTLIQRWKDAEDSTVEIDDVFFRAVRRGLVEYDDGARVFRVKLRHPVTLENGETLSILEIRALTAGEVKAAQRGRLRANARGDTEIDPEIVYRMISTMTGHPLGVIERLDGRDFSVCASAIGFFQ